ncbi:MAG: hypothetical protein ACFFCW_32060 [Candidatus Hodarchaeota archaeon]
MLRVADILTVGINELNHLPAVELATNVAEAASLNLPEKLKEICGSACIA